MNDIEGKAMRGTATEPGREGVSIMKDEMKAKRGCACIATRSVARKLPASPLANAFGAADLVPR